MLQLRDMNNLRRPQSLLLALALLASASVGACAQGQQTAGQPAAGQQANARPQQSSNPLDTILQGPRFTTTPLESPDWMKRSRTGREQTFIPTGPPDGQPQRPVLTPDQVRAREAELDGIRRRHDQIAGRNGYRGKVGSATAPPIKREKPKPMPCMLTCDTGLGTTTRK